MKDQRDLLTGPEDCVDNNDPLCRCNDATIPEIRLQEVTPIDFITRAESEESQPGAFAIPGIEITTLRRQERVLMRRARSPEPTELLINAVVVDEEQPSLVFEASPLTIQKGNWKWITAILLLLSLLVCSVALGLLQGSIHSKIKGDTTPSKALDGNTSENITDIKSQPSMPAAVISSTPSDIPSLTPSKVLSTAPSVYQANWSKVGQDIAGEQHGDGIGKSLALSSSGKVLAVGLRSFDFGTEVDIGVVRIYELGSDGLWQQNGQDLAGSTAGEQAGCALDMSSDGSIVAVASCTGVVRVFEFNRAFSFWYPLGQELVVGGGKNASIGLSLSDDGLTLVAGVDLADEYGTGAIEKVFLFQFSRDLAAWAPTAQAFYEEDNGDRLGSAVCLSGNGEVVAMASVGHDSTTGVDVGLVQVFNKQVDLEWTTLGGPLSGIVGEDAFGTSISLSMNGMVLAVTSRSSISIYHFDFEIQDWVKDDVDNPLIDEDVSFDNANETVVNVSLDGKMMAVSRARSASLSGSVRVYALDANETQWVLVGEPIETGNEAEWYTSPSVALSDNGVLAIGYLDLGSGGGSNFGRVQTYNFA